VGARVMDVAQPPVPHVLLPVAASESRTIPLRIPSRNRLVAYIHQQRVWMAYELLQASSGFCQAVAKRVDGATLNRAHAYLLCPRVSGCLTSIGSAMRCVQQSVEDTSSPGKTSPSGCCSYQQPTQALGM